MKATTQSLSGKCVIILVLFFLQNLTAQSIFTPTFAFTKACASSSFNTFPVNFNFTPPGPGSFQAGNTFFLQLSDANGVFSASPSEVASSSTILVGPGTLVFNVPTNFVGGEGYRFRIRSTSPAVLSPPSAVVPIHYLIFSDSFYINNQSPTAVFCTGSKVILSIDNPSTPPASYTNLTYKWFRDNVAISGAITSSLEVSIIGIYRVEIDYGSCSTVGSITKSQEVTVSTVPGLQAITINSNTGNTIPASGFTTLSGIQNSSFAYQWFKEGVAIIGANAFNYVTNQPGNYYLRINNSNCSTLSNTVTLVLGTAPPVSGAILPNVISPNGDGINDTWVIPAEYIAGTNTNIVISNHIGEVVYQTKNYLGDWPQVTIDYSASNPVYYYIVTPQNGEVKKGTITIIK